MAQAPELRRESAGRAPMPEREAVRWREAESATVSCLVELGGNLLRKKTMCLVATVLKLNSIDGAICNQTYGKIVCM